jgi:hypothetical protein
MWIYGMQIKYQYHINMRLEIELLYQNLCAIIHNTKKACNSYCSKSDRPNFFLVE